VVGSSSSSVVFRSLYENVIALSIDNNVDVFVEVFDHVFARSSNGMFIVFW